MSDWKNAFRSFYYATAELPEDPVLRADDTALLVIDIQNTYMEVPDDPSEAARWRPFHNRMADTVDPLPLRRASSHWRMPAMVEARSGSLRRRAVSSA